MPVIDLTVLTGGDIKALSALEKGLAALKIPLEDVAVQSTKFNVATGDFTSKVIGMNKAGQTLSVTLKQIKGELTADTVALENNAKAAKNAAIAKTNLAKITKNVAGGRSVLEAQYNTKDYKPNELAKHREQISQITKLIAESIEGYKHFDAALNAVVAGSVAGLKEEEHQFYNILKRMADKEAQVADRMAKDSKSKADKIARDAARRSDAGVAKGSLAGVFDTKNLGIQQLQSFDNKLEATYRRIEEGKLEFSDFADAVDIYFSKAVKNASPKAQQIIQLFKTLDATVAASDKKISDASKKKQDKVDLRKTRRSDSDVARKELEKHFPTTGFGAEQLAAQQGRFNTIVKGIAKGTSDIGHFNDAVKAFFSKSTAGLEIEGHQILKILNNIENYKNKTQAKLTRRGDAVTAKKEIDALRTGGTFNTKNLSIQQLQSVENKLGNLYHQIAKDKLALKDFRAAIDQHIRGIGSLVTPEAEKVVRAFQTIDAAIAAADKKITDKAKAKLDKADLIKKRGLDAAGARSALEKLFPKSGLTAEQGASQDARVNAITRGVQKGTFDIKHFNDAVGSYFSSTTAGLDEESHRILKIVNNIVNYQNKITAQNTKKAADAATKAANETAGRGLLAAEKKKALPNFLRLDVGAQERVRNQFDKIQALFSKGLDPSKFVRAFQVANQGATHELDKLESIVRHRLERINIELDKGHRKPFLSNYFGGGGGDSGGIPTDLIKGALLAKGVTNLVSTLESVLQKSSEYSKQVALIRTITQDADVATGAWKQGLAQVSNILGRGRDEVAHAGYDLLSNQITKGADSFQILVHAGNLANTTNSSLVSSVNILSSAIQSFGLRATDTEKLAAAFFTTIDLGRVKIEEIADVFGRPALAAKTLGVSFEELAASIITISQTGINVEQTNTLITNVFHKLINPTKELQVLYDKLGVSTGEMFIKTYGFTGVLKILQRETGGSVAKLSELFNEIRGEQGINALIDRLGIYEDALDKVTNSTEKYKSAIDEVNQSSGQKFQVELQKINNYFASWSDWLLDATVKLADYGGGIANVVVQLSRFSFGVLGVGGAALLLTNRLDALLITSGLLQKGLIALRLQLSTLLPLLALGFAAFEFGRLLGTLYQLDHEYETFYERRTEQLQKYREQAEKENARIAEAFAKPFKELNKQHGADTLQAFGNVVANLKTLQESQKEAFKDSGKYFENASQVFISGLKKKLEEVRSAIKEIEDLKKDFNKTRAGVNEHRRDFIYDYAHKVNELNVAHGGQDVSRQIDQKRLRQLTSDAAKIFKDPLLTPKQKAEELNRIYDKKRELVEHMAGQTHTDPATGQTELVYSVQKSTQRLRNVDRERLHVLHLQNAALAKQKDILDAQEKKRTEALKGAEDAVAKIVHFKAFDEGTGKLRKGTPEATLKEFDEYAKDAMRQLEEARQQGEGTAQDLLSSKQRLEQERENLVKVLDTYTKRTNIEDLRNQYTKASDPARLKALQDASVTAENERSRSEATVKGYSENLVEQGQHAIDHGYNVVNPETGASENVESDKKQEARRKAQANLEYANNLIQTGRHDEAIQYYDNARGWAKYGGFHDEAMAGPTQDIYKDGKPTGEKVTQPSTFGSQVTSARAAASTAAYSTNVAKDTTAEFQKSEQKSNTLLAQMTIIVRKYGDLAGSTTAFAEKSKTAWEASAANVGAVNFELGITITKLDDIGKKAIETAGKIATIDNGVAKQLGQAQAAAATVGGGPQPAQVQPTENYTGGLIHRAGGGLIYSPKGSDNIPVLAANHEFMMNQQSTARFLPQLIAMNSGFEPSFSRQSQSTAGDHYNFGDMHINVGGSQSGHQTAKDIVNGIKRGIRRGTLSI